MIDATIGDLVQDFAFCIKRIDSRRPQAKNARTGEAYQPGIGPHGEPAVVQLVALELAILRPDLYQECSLGVSYPGLRRQQCDLCIGTSPRWRWAIEVKMLRLMGDNGRPNDNMLTHILSPYPGHRSALTDCQKLACSDLPGRKAVLIYGFDYPQLGMEPAIDAFETLAKQRVSLSDRYIADYNDLIHPVHTSGRVFGWEIRSL
jgi:hypothetical protein